MRAETNLGRWLLAALVLCSAVGCYTSNEEGVGGESHFLSCKRNAECAHLGPEWSCVDGQCQVSDGPKPSASDDAGSAPAPGEQPATGGSAGSAVGGANPIAASTPLVIVVLDTSGSMERMIDCECTTPGCEECLPKCAQSERNRFAHTLEVLTGSFDDFACEAIDRGTFAEDSYDVGYYLPYHRPSGRQRDDGLLDAYRDRLRFGLATFDGWDTWLGAPPLVAHDDFDFERSAGEAGLWSYNPARDIPGFTQAGSAPIGNVFYPNCVTTYYMDTGIRNEHAESGALALATDLTRAGEVNAEIQRSLLAVRPYGGTPIASSLDDLRHLIAQDPRMAGERERNAVPHVVLITDGYPDDDYRTFGCDCSTVACRELPALEQETMTCPYPRAEEAARALRCGRDAECASPAAELHVIGLATRDPAVRDRLAAIAIAGDRPARFANSALELRAELDAVLSEIAR
jgi:type IV pilus assembly protein PilY1